MEQNAALRETCERVEHAPEAISLGLVVSSTLVVSMTGCRGLEDDVVAASGPDTTVEIAAPIAVSSPRLPTTETEIAPAVLLRDRQGYPLIVIFSPSGCGVIYRVHTGISGCNQEMTNSPGDSRMVASLPTPLSTTDPEDPLLDCAKGERHRGKHRRHETTERHRRHTRRHSRHEDTRTTRRLGAAIKSIARHPMLLPSTLPPPLSLPPVHLRSHASSCSRESAQIDAEAAGVVSLPRFPCLHPGCDETSKSEAAAIIHSRIHTGQRPYKCQICNWAFIRDGNLVKHLKEKHDFVRPAPVKVKCPQAGCVKVFYPRLMTSHMRMHKNGEGDFREHQNSHKVATQSSTANDENITDDDATLPPALTEDVSVSDNELSALQRLQRFCSSSSTSTSAAAPTLGADSLTVAQPMQTSCQEDASNATMQVSCGNASFSTANTSTCLAPLGADSLTVAQPMQTSCQEDASVAQTTVRHDDPPSAPQLLQIVTADGSLELFSLQPPPGPHASAGEVSGVDGSMQVSCGNASPSHGDVSFLSTANASTCFDENNEAPLLGADTSTVAQPMQSLQDSSLHTTTTTTTTTPPVPSTHLPELKYLLDEGWW